MIVTRIARPAARVALMVAAVSAIVVAGCAPAGIGSGSTPAATTSPESASPLIGPWSADCPTRPRMDEPEPTAALRLVAPKCAGACGFDTTRLAAPSGVALTLEYTVEDDGKPHNFALYRDPERDELLLESEYLIDGQQTTIEIAPMEPGTYHFVCQPHINKMFGTLTIVDS